MNPVRVLIPLFTHPSQISTQSILMEMGLLTILMLKTF